jgi:hypothetical protein
MGTIAEVLDSRDILRNLLLRELGSSYKASLNSYRRNGHGQPDQRGAAWNPCDLGPPWRGAGRQVRVLGEGLAGQPGHRRRLIGAMSRPSSRSLPPPWDLA